MPGRFTGKVVIVTGAAQGIGEQTARRIDAEGGTLVGPGGLTERLDHLRDLGDLSTAFLDELDAFFAAYRMLESKGVEVRERQGRDAAVAMLTGP